MPEPFLQGKRPKKVELLFNAEGSEMAEGPGLRYLHISHIKYGRRDVVPTHLLSVDGDRNGEKYERRREDAKRSADIKIS